MIVDDSGPVHEQIRANLYESIFADPVDTLLL